MISLGLGISLLSFALAFVSATPIHEDITDAAATANFADPARRATSPLSATQIASFRPYTIYAAIPGCGPASLLAWNCAKCSSNPEFTPVDAGGDGGLVQIWYVGYDATLDTVIVSFEGTDSQKIIPVIINADIILTPLDSTRFPGISSDIQTHNGFAIAQSLSAAPVLSAVKTTMSRFNTSHVTVVGNSLGAAIATISSIHLKLNLPSTTTFKLVAYGSPRVGNQAFADYVDAHFPAAVSRIVNKKDIIPILPPMFLGFHHVEGELHILNDLSWVSCPGQDNPDPNCSIGYTPDVFSANVEDHGGPYDGIMMGC